MPLDILQDLEYESISSISIRCFKTTTVLIFFRKTLKK